MSQGMLKGVWLMQAWNLVTNVNEIFNNVFFCQTLKLTVDDPLRKDN